MPFLSMTSRFPWCTDFPLDRTQGSCSDEIGPGGLLSLTAAVEPSSPTLMKSIMKSILSEAFPVFFLVFGAPSGQASLLTNGDFETGDFTGWTDDASGASVTGSGALEGSFSASFPASGGDLSQSFAPVTSPVTVSLLFTMGDPGGGGNRGFNLSLRDAGAGEQINLRVVDGSNDGDGDVQIFDGQPGGGGGSWQTVSDLNDSVSFSSTNDFSLTIHTFGGSFDYDVTINGQTASGLSFQQNDNSFFAELDTLAFVNQFSQGGYVVDDVSVTAIPEPSGFALIGLLGGLAWWWRRVPVRERVALAGDAVENR